MTMTKTYTTRSNAKRAAVTELGTDAIEGADYRLIETGNRWGWTTGNQPEPAPESAAGEETVADIEEDVATAEAGFARPTTKLPWRDGTKQARVIEMLRKPGGVTIDDVVAATNWVRHSVRGFFSAALKKKLGLNVVSEKIDGQRRYRIPG